MACPCSVGESFETCCGPIISGQVEAPTAEALMRARYSAYSAQKVDFLLDSIHPESPGEVDRKSTEVWAKFAEWHGLEILGTKQGGKDDNVGEVEFVAKFSLKGEPQRHHERAEFRRHGGKWRYFDGVDIKPQPVKGARLKLTRNDACPCGSGKKFKKCCSPVWESGAQTPEQLVRGRFAAGLAGEGNFLSRSLHPEAKQPGDQEREVVWSDLSLSNAEVSGDTAVITASFKETAQGKTSTRREKIEAKRHNNKWLLLKSDDLA